MAANTAPIYSRLGSIQWAPDVVKTANTAKDGTGTVATIFTADGTNGGRVERIVCRAAGSNVATVLRIFVNNGSDNTVAANNCLISELTLPATTLSETAQLLDQTLSASPFPIVLPPGYKLNVTVGTTVAAGYYVSAHGGAY